MKRVITFSDLERESSGGLSEISSAGGGQIDRLDSSLFPTLADVILVAQNEIHELGILSLMDYRGTLPSFDLRLEASLDPIFWHHDEGCFVVIFSEKRRLTHTPAVRDKDLLLAFLKLADRRDWDHELITFAFSSRRGNLPVALGIMDRYKGEIFSEINHILHDNGTILEFPWRENEVRIYSDKYWYHARTLPENIDPDTLQQNPSLSVCFLNTIQQIKGRCNFLGV